jgi:hypothetical protein
MPGDKRTANAAGHPGQLAGARTLWAASYLIYLGERCREPKGCALEFLEWRKRAMPLNAAATIVIAQRRQ